MALFLTRASVSLTPQIEKSPIDRIVGSGDKRSLVRAQEQGKVRDFLRLCHSSDRLRLFQFLEHLSLFARVIFPQEAVYEGRMDSRRRNAIATNVMGQIILGHRVSHGNHSALA